jgi:hypothetical protein
VAIDVNHLPEAAQELGDLTQREHDVLALLREGLASREYRRAARAQRGDRLPGDRRSTRRARVQATRCLGG